MSHSFILTFRSDHDLWCIWCIWYSVHM